MRILLAFGCCLCALLAPAATRTVHVRGTISNLHALGLKGWYSALNIRSATWLAPASGPDPATKQFNGELECNVVRDALGQWVDIELTAMAYVQGRDRSMIIRVPYKRNIDLGTFDWKPSRYRWKPDGLHIETALPRDTVIGSVDDPTLLIIRPINPAPTDSVRFEFIWENSGQPHQASMGGVYMKDCCTYLCDFTFAVRTDTDVYGESWPHHALLWLPPKLEAGRYRIRQVPAQGTNLRDVDFLLGKDLYFTVGEREEP
jgi:hypothetical protein